ncbi:MAG: hypothetical protein ACYC1L_06165 [Alphaproteobacteria bacterium]
MTKTTQDGEKLALEARRRFLANCGKFAVVTPPVVSLMLSASHRSYAAVGSGGSRRQGNNGFGNGGGDGVPGNSGNNRSPNAGQKGEDDVR